MCHAGITSKLLNSGLIALPKVKFRKEILFSIYYVFADGTASGLSDHILR
jgi:hypothetical protein